jgi:hypothetical protein
MPDQVVTPSQTQEAFAANVPQAGLDPETADAPLSHGTPSEALLGVLPLARWIPMDVHAVMDYANALVVGSGAIATDCPRARAASSVLAAAGIMTSAMTDYRLSAVQVVPIEAHEAIDHLWGAAAIAAPFVLGYWKTAPRVALTHVIAGAGNILASLVTDYRAYRGVGRAQR